jgi:hypothetical protein
MKIQDDEGNDIGIVIGTDGEEPPEFVKEMAKALAAQIMSVDPAEHLAEYVTKEIAGEVLWLYDNEDARTLHPEWRPTAFKAALMSAIRYGDLEERKALNDPLFHGYVLAIVLLAEKPAQEEGGLSGMSFLWDIVNDTLKESDDDD